MGPRPEVLLGVTALLLAVVVMPPPAQAGGGAQYVQVDLGTLGGPGAIPVAVNDLGQVVGYSFFSNTLNPRAFLWTATAGMISLGSLGGRDSRATAVNAQGQVVGFTYWMDGGPGGPAFSWTATAGMIDLGTLGGRDIWRTYSRATAVNDLGQVVGSSSTDNYESHAFSWTATAGMIDLGTLGGNYSYATAVNAQGQVVGYSHTAGDAELHAFSWTATAGMIDLGTLGGSYSYATAVNAQGQVVGYSHTAGDAEAHAFSWTATAGMVDLGTLGGSYSYATAVNAQGEVVGYSHTAGDAEEHAFLWTATAGMIDLGTLGGFTNSYASAVNDLGQVVGSSSTDNYESHAFSWTSTAGMIDLGGIPGGGSTYATAVNAQGQVVGYGFPLHQPAPRSPYAERALLWTVADTTPPLITPDVQGMLGQNGWYRSDVTVTWDLTDPESAITSSSGCGATTITTDTQGTTITCTATSLGGTSSRSVTIRRDATPPTITCAPSPNTLWPPNQKLIPVTTTITVSDSGSGPDGFLLTSLGVNEGDLASDMQGWTVATPDMSGLLRAARFGSGSGRIYALDYEGKDAAGNTATCSATVTVPHDNGRP